METILSICDKGMVICLCLMDDSDLISLYDEMITGNEEIGLDFVINEMAYRGLL